MLAASRSRDPARIGRDATLRVPSRLASAVSAARARTSRV
jgi:hypothetical protein